MTRHHYVNKTARLSTPQKSWSLIGQIKSCTRLPISCARLSKLCARVPILCAQDGKSWERVNKSCARHKIFHLHVPLGAPYTSVSLTVLVASCGKATIFQSAHPSAPYSLLIFIHSGYLYSASSSLLLWALQLQQWYCVRVNTTKVATSEGFAQGPYVATKVEFDLATFWTQGTEPTSEPLHPIIVSKPQILSLIFCVFY